MRTAALHLALAGILLRGLIPVGDMLMFGSPGHPGISIMLCPYTTVMSMDMTIDASGHEHAGSGTVVPHSLCPFAVAAAHGMVVAIAIHFHAPTFSRPINDGEPLAYQIATLRRPPVRGPPAALFMIG